MVVAGTHGKTTSATLLATVLREAGRDPGWFIGGMPLDLPRSYAARRRPRVRARGRRVRLGLLRQGGQVLPLPAAGAAAERGRVRPRRHLPRPRARQAELRAPARALARRRAAAGVRGLSARRRRRAARRPRLPHVLGRRRLGCRLARAGPRGRTGRSALRRSRSRRGDRAHVAAPRYDERAQRARCLRPVPRARRPRRGDPARRRSLPRRAPPPAGPGRGPDHADRRLRAPPDGDRGDARGGAQPLSGATRLGALRPALQHQPPADVPERDRERRSAPPRAS